MVRSLADRTFQLSVGRVRLEVRREGELGAAVASVDGARYGPRVRRLVERFDRRRTEPFELFRSEFGQSSFKIQEFSLENSKISEIFNIL